MSLSKQGIDFEKKLLEFSAIGNDYLLYFDNGNRPKTDNLLPSLNPYRKPLFLSNYEISDLYKVLPQLRSLAENLIDEAPPNKLNELLEKGLFK